MAKTERLDKYIASRGLSSRSEVKLMLKRGEVTVNGKVVSDPAFKVCVGDCVTVNGKRLSSSQYTYIMLNKPRGYVTTLSDEKGRKNAAELVSACGQRVYPVGRLDMDSEGLLLFTNDGDFANHLMHPKHEVNKTYAVTVKGFTKSGLERFAKPMHLDGYKLQIPIISLINSYENGAAQLHITIHEGRNRQVRRMCAIAGMRVTRLVRISEGTLMLGELPTGKWRYLTPAELTDLWGNDS